jgi:hypothetical protein
MHFSTILAVASVAFLPAFASPGAGESLVVRGGKCKSDLEWDGWSGSCKCKDRGSKYDDKYGYCAYPPKPKPVCPYGEQSYCAHSDNDYGKYDQGDKRCRDDGKSYTFCCKEKDAPKKAKEVCPPQKHKDCKGGQFYDWKKDACVCKHGEVFRHGKCQCQPLQRPHCPYGQKAYCAKDKDNYAEYDENHDYCNDDGYHKAFCCEPPKVKDYCKKNYHY